MKGRRKEEGQEEWQTERGKGREQREGMERVRFTNCKREDKGGTIKRKKKTNWTIKRRTKAREAKGGDESESITGQQILSTNFRKSRDSKIYFEKINFA